MSEIFSVQGILALLLGGLYGAIFGAIPGLTATLAIALFIPIAFFLDPSIALPAIIAISSVAIFAGDVGSTVARIPGTPASAAYFEKLFTGKVKVSYKMQEINLIPNKFKGTAKQLLKEYSFDELKHNVLKGRGSDHCRNDEPACRAGKTAG